MFFSAVVQNSRKWNTESARRKKGTLHPGLSVQKRMMVIDIRDSEAAMPRQKARRAMPERLLDPFGKKGRRVGGIPSIISGELGEDVEGVEEPLGYLRLGSIAKGGTAGGRLPS